MSTETELQPAGVTLEMETTLASMTLYNDLEPQLPDVPVQVDIKRH